MMGVDVSSIVKPLEAGLASLRAARVFVRRVGPNLTVNVVITNVTVGPDEDGDVTASVTVQPGQEPIVDTTPPTRAAAEESAPEPAELPAKKPHASPHSGSKSKTHHKHG